MPDEFKERPYAGAVLTGIQEKESMAEVYPHFKKYEDLIKRLSESKSYYDKELYKYVAQKYTEYKSDYFKDDLRK